MEQLLSKRITVKMETVDICVGVITMLTGLFLLLVGVPKFISVGFSTAGTILTPKSFPTLIGWAVLLLGAIVFWRGVSEKRKKKATGQESETVTFYMISLAVGMLCLFFLLTLRPLGYPIANAITLLGMYYLSSGKSLVKGLAMSLIFSVVSTWFFFVYLKLSIPLGPLQSIIYSLVY